MGIPTFAADISGILLDAQANEPLIAATVFVISTKDTTQRRYATTDNAGAFLVKNLKEQRYTVEFRYLGYTTQTQQVNLGASGKSFGTVKLTQDGVELDAVQIQAQAVRATQRGDTTDFNADAYKVTQDASAEDLIKKLPGISVEGGTVKTQGEEVKKVLVDGKPFFGDDPTIAIKNLPAEVIARIEVYNQLSDQAQLTGIDDGESEKTINIVTRPNRRVGQFGRMYAGLGYDDKQEEWRYSAGGNINLFNQLRRVSVVAMTNNINQQNFASEDMTGISSSGGGRRGGNVFSSAPSAGISTTSAVGINYNETFGEKLEISGSYFFNSVDNENSSTLNREYFTGYDSTQYYQQWQRSETRNYNHRLNLKFDYKFNKNTSILYQPSLSYTDNDARSADSSIMVGASHSYNASKNHRQSFNLNNDLLFRHKFATPGRTFSANVRANFSDNSTDKIQESQADYFASNSTDIKNQASENPTNSWSARTRLMYTEPFGKRGIIQLSYSLNLSHGESNKRTYNVDSLNIVALKLDSLYSNIYSNGYATQRGGLSYRMMTDKMNAMVGLDFQNAQLNGEQIMPARLNVDKSFNTLLPIAMMEYKFSKQQSFRAFFRSYTNAPSISQLQSVVDNSNPLLLKVGNPDLSETYNQMLALNYNQTSLEKGITFFAQLWGSTTNSYITSYSITAKKDSLIRTTTSGDSIWLRKGSQYATYRNVDGFWNTRAMATLGVPVGVVKSNMNLSAGFSYMRIPGFVNGASNIANTISPNAGAALSSNISEKVDFMLSYNATYNIVKNTLEEQNSNYFKHNASFTGTWITWKGITLQGVANYEQYKGLSAGYDQEYLRLDASIGKKFLADNRAEIKFSVYDMLNQAKNYSRSVTESYIEDSGNRILSRYFMLSLVYSLRNFGTPPSRQNNNDTYGPPPGGGGFRRGEGPRF
jgi:hypothetical protein